MKLDLMLQVRKVNPATAEHLKRLTSEQQQTFNRLQDAVVKFAMEVDDCDAPDCALCSLFKEAFILG